MQMAPMAHEYIRAIRNPAKKLYARAYDAWLRNGKEGPEPEGVGLSTMGRQSVRLILFDIYKETN